MCSQQPKFKASERELRPAETSL